MGGGGRGVKDAAKAHNQWVAKLQIVFIFLKKGLFYNNWILLVATVRQYLLEWVKQC